MLRFGTRKNTTIKPNARGANANLVRGQPSAAVPLVMASEIQSMFLAGESHRLRTGSAAVGEVECCRELHGDGTRSARVHGRAALVGDCVDP